MRRWVLTIVLWCVGWVSGCAGSTLPQPPNLAPVNPDQLAGSVTENVPLDLEIGAGPGAAPAAVDVWIWNLDRGDAPVVVRSNDEGAFQANIPHTDGEELRFQTRRGLERGTPVDLVYNGGFSSPMRPFCLEVPLEVDLGRDRAGTVVIENGCEDAVAIESATLRSSPSPLTVEPPVAASVPVGARFEIVVRAPGVGTAEDILFIEARLPGPARYPVTVITRAE
ncbi:MAG: hypothetical protein AAGF12_09320 [Myxococcota bacterium]